MKAVLAAITVLIAAGFASMRIRSIAKGNGTTAEKIAAIRAQLKKVLAKMNDYAKATDPTWDDDFVTMLGDAVDAVADEVIAELEATA
jgi:tripartite-type tricarboxylate transporter receptor subunit TctC